MGVGEVKVSIFVSTRVVCGETVVGDGDGDENDNGRITNVGG